MKLTGRFSSRRSELPCPYRDYTRTGALSHGTREILPQRYRSQAFMQHHDHRQRRVARGDEQCLEPPAIDGDEGSLLCRLL